MADSKLELVVTVDADKANASIKSVNAGLSSLETTAVSAARGASRGIDGMTASMTKAVIAGQAIYNAVLSAARALKSLAMGALETQDQIAKTAQRIGVSTEHLSELRHIAGLSGLSFEELSTAIARFARNAAKGSDVLAALGISTRNADRSSRDMMEILEDLAGRFSAMPDDMQKTAVAIDLFGRGGARMIPLLNQGAAGLREMRREARELGMVVDESTARQAERLRDNLQRLKAAIDGLVFELVRRLAPSLIEITDSTIRWVREGGLDRLAGYLRAAAEWVRNIGVWIVQYAVVKNVLELASALRAAAVAAGGLSAAMAANPWGLAAAGVATLGVVIWREKERLDQYQESMTRAAEKAALMKAIAEGATLEQLKAQGYTEDTIRQAIAGPEEAAIQPQRGLGFDMGDVEALQEQRRRMAEAERRAAELLRQAREGELSGVARVIAEYQRYREELGLSARAQRDLAAAAEIRIRAELRAEREKIAEAAVAEIERAAELRRRALADKLRLETEFEQETLERAMDAARARLRSEETVAAQIRDARRRELDLAEVRIARGDPASQAAVVQQRLEIEQDYLMRRFALRAGELRRESEIEIATMETIARARGIAEEQISARRDAILRDYAERARQLEAETQAAIDAARQDAAVRQAQTVRDHNQRVFESLKRQAEGVFDALLTKSQSVWSAIGNALKTALLTAIKEVVTSRVAALLMQLLGGMRAPVAAGGAGRMAAVGALGAFPALGAGPIPSGAAGGWGTPPFIPGGAGGFAGFGGWLRSGGWMDLATAGGLALMLGGLARRNTALTILGASLGLARLGIHGTQLGMVGGAGAGLALAGLMRGGLGGFAMTTAGGAILGWQFGGPLGAAIGAGIGAIAGLFSSLFKSAEEKTREKIRATYGVDIRDKGVLRQILETAKQAFGGNLDMAIRSRQIRDLVELYALSTGQSTAGLPATVKPVTLAQQGGSLFQSSLGGLIGTGIPSTAATSAPVVVNFQIDSRTIGQVIVKDGRIVSQSLQQGMKANAGRREIAALQVSPGLITA